MTLEQVDPFLAKKAEKFKAAAERGLLSAAHRIVTRIKTEVIPDTRPVPVDTGAYRASWNAKKIEGGALVYSSKPMQAAIVEDGVRAENVKIGRAMIEALTSWARRKGLDGARGKNAHPESVAWAVATVIKQRGIPARRVLERASSRAGEFVAQEVRRELAKG